MVFSIMEIRAAQWVALFCYFLKMKVLIKA